MSDDEDRDETVDEEEDSVEYSTSASNKTEQHDDDADQQVQDIPDDDQQIDDDPQGEEWRQHRSIKKNDTVRVLNTTSDSWRTVTVTSHQIKYTVTSCHP